MIQFALKEWAVICHALANGRQSLLLRKGGVAEVGGEFRVDQPRFLLYPTYVHQQREGIQTDALALLQQAEADRPPDGIIRFSHFAEVEAVSYLEDLHTVLALNDLHIWSEETVRSRFAYRRPGLFAILVRTFAFSQPIEVPELESYAGCKSWVDLEQQHNTDASRPVLEDGAMRSP